MLLPVIIPDNDLLLGETCWEELIMCMLTNKRYSWKEIPI